MAWHITLSNLSIAEQIDLNLSCGTPHASNIPFNMSRWLIFITDAPISKEFSTLSNTFMHSISGSMGSCAPTMSKSYEILENL